jgi:hypothetical protein
MEEKLLVWTEVRSAEERELEWERRNRAVEEEYVKRHLELLYETEDDGTRERRMGDLKAEMGLEMGAIDFIFTF